MGARREGSTGTKRNTKLLREAGLDLAAMERAYVAHGNFKSKAEALQLRKAWWELPREVRMLHQAIAYLRGLGHPWLVDVERAIVATPFGGAHGLAGYVIALNGTPPRATIIAHTESGPLTPGARVLELVVLSSRGRFRHIKSWHASAPDARIIEIVDAWIGWRLREHPLEVHVGREGLGLEPELGDAEGQ